MRVLTSAAAQAGPELPAWLQAGGGLGLQRALQAPDRIIEVLRDAGLRGLGGAGFPTHLKWHAVAALAPLAGQGKWLICNGNEDEPGTFKDRYLLSRTPHQVIEGALIGALAVAANHVVLYVNPGQPEAVTSVSEAVQAWSGHPLLAQVAEAVGTPVELHVIPGSGLYVGGEETAAVASVMGGFPFPSLKPPFPAEAGVHGAPTLINNTETFAHVPHILRHGAAWYRTLGRGAAAGTKLYSLSGDVMRPGLHELPMGVTLRELIFIHGGGMLGSRPFKAVFTGGPSNTLLTAADLDVALDFDSVRERGSRLGTGAMIVVGEGTSVLRKTAEYVAFFADNSCGQCSSCKIGTHQVSRILDRIDGGAGRQSDLKALENLARLLPGSGRCGLVDGAATVLASSLSTFRHEYERALNR
ncbi:complex I 51 kDa subunit family protein [Chitinasiproducens palmae]|nr:NADH-ubiquinone oxidoreductase-F iron-sulfur binding region domain-containing protein [Chitinasiproducens palmae]